MKVLTFLVLLPAVWAQCTQDVNCLQGQCELYDFCACASGVSGSVCNTNVSSCDAQFVNVSASASDNAPTLDTQNSGIFGGSLTLRLASPLVHNRVSTYIYLADANLYPACALGNWSKSFVSCEEQYDFSLAWADAVNCGFVEDSSVPGQLTYTNNIFIRHNDSSETLRGYPVYADVVYSFPIQLTLDTQVTVTSGALVYAPIGFLSAISAVTYDGSVGTVQLTTSLQWPFVLVDAAISSSPNGLSTSLASSNLSCASTADAVCTQRYTLTLTPTTACTLTGSYTFTYTIVCRGAEADCPIDPNNDTATVTVSVVATDFCTQLDVNIGLTGSMNSFSDAGLTTGRTSFLPDQRAYYRASLSTANTATILSCDIVTIYATNSTPIILRQNSANTASGNSTSLVIDTSNPYQPKFDLVPVASVFPVPADGSVRFTISATIDVTYSSGARKRMLLQKRQTASGTQSTVFVAEMSVSNPSPPAPPSSALGTQGSGGVPDSSAALLAVLLPFLLA